MILNRLFNGILPAILLIAMYSCSESVEDQCAGSPGPWPEPSATMKPWTRWWWMGSAVDRQNITKRLEEFAIAGIGGVEITPIFGVKGYEQQFLQHLSPQWMEMLIHTLDEADRLGLGADMVLGTGWPFGGPQVEADYAASKILIRTFSMKAGERFSQKIISEDPVQENLCQLQYVFAFDNEGQNIDLGSQMEGEWLNWTPDRDYVLYAVFLTKTGQQVKRSAPGGEGYTLDHFSLEALMDYLEPYDRVLAPARNSLRAVFNDSYEVYGADYTSGFFEEFQQRRGYDARDYLPCLLPDTTGEDVLRIKSDYRETLSDLVLEAFSENWVRWAGDNTFLARYQAHGSPGNLLDIYASADIPECESFYATKFDIPGSRWEESDARQAFPDLIMLKFASSAAHISGKHLTSSETLTWLREHFKTALSQCKPEIEQIFLAGVNHVFFHGSTYSPDEAEWPGWKFYASVNFVPTYTIWKDAPNMFEYITRCQSMLQSGKSDNELLLYWPFHDVIGEDLDGQLLFQLGIENKDLWLTPTSFYCLAGTLIEQGYSVDFISDSYLEKTGVEKGMIKTPGMDYKALIIPECRHMPLATMESLASIVESGGKVIFEGLPETVPGYHLHMDRTDQLKDMINRLKYDMVISRDVPSILDKMGIRGEVLKDNGLDFIRRDMEDGYVYYLVNHTPDRIDGYSGLGCRAKSVMIMDPLTGETGKARIKSKRKTTEVYIQMEPGQAILLRTFGKGISDSGMNESRLNEPVINAAPWEYYEITGDPVNLAGTWEIEFLEGGPSIPEDAQMEELRSWTNLGEQATAFSGTARYTLRFDNPDPGVSNWMLDLGDVRESARVWINGVYMDCLWSVPFTIETGTLQEGRNTLEVEVTNLSANRIRDMELRGIEWKYFYKINMVNRHYERFDATLWDPMPSGLLGPVSLAPLGRK